MFAGWCDWNWMGHRRWIIFHHYTSESCSIDIPLSRYQIQTPSTRWDAHVRRRNIYVALVKLTQPRPIDDSPLSANFPSL